MADGDWDLYAIVRSCTSAAVNTSSSNSNTNTSVIPIENNGNFENHLDCLASLTFDDDDDDPFSFPNLELPRNNGWQELQNSYKPFLPNTSTQGNFPLSSIYNSGEFSGQNQPQLAQPQPQPQHHHHLQQQQPPIAATLTLTPPPSPPLTNSTFSLRFNNIQQQLQHAQQPPPYRRQLHHQQQSSQRAAETCTPPVLPLPTTTQSPVSRSRKKKNQLKRQVMQVTAENLCNDVWAWRKYGQKPIKGSPYPRNYYRCSSSKGCAARKQVERSNIDPNMFIVSYTGEHTHPRPTHRNSLAGSTRNKFQALHKPPAANKESDEAEKAPCSSPLSGTSLSPTTPLSAASMDHEATAAEAADESIKLEAGNMNIGADMDGHKMESDEDNEYDDDHILIPNMTFNEDLINALQSTAVGTTSTRTGGLGHSPDFGDNFSSWAVGSSAAAGGRG